MTFGQSTVKIGKKDKQQRRRDFVISMIIFNCSVGFYLAPRIAFLELIFIFIMAFFPILSIIEDKVLRGNQAILFILFGLILLLGSLYTSNIGDGIAFSLKKIFIFVTAIYLIKEPMWSKRLIYCFLFVSGLFALMGILQFFLPDIILPINKLILTDEQFSTNKWLADTWLMYCGIAPQASYQANFIIPGLAIAFSFALCSKQRKVFYMCYTGMAFLAMILTRKRTPMLAVFISVAVTYIVICIFTKGNKIRKTIIGIIAIGGLFYLVMYTSFGISLLERFQDEGLSGREYMWSQSFDLWKRNILFGVGTNYIAQNTSISNHNMYLQILAENGLVGGIIFSCIILSELLNTGKSLIRFHITSSGEAYIGIVISLFLQVFYLGFGFASSVYTTESMFLPFIIFSIMPYSIMRNELLNN